MNFWLAVLIGGLTLTNVSTSMAAWMIERDLRRLLALLAEHRVLLNEIEHELKERERVLDEREENLGSWERLLKSC